MTAPIFHLAFPIGDVTLAKQFYAEGLGCEIGRETKQAVILNLKGHQLVGHVTQEPIALQKGIYPRHFGLIFPVLADWQELLNVAQEKSLKFYQQPKHRFPGEILEHRTFFLEDPFGNLLEFKYYSHWEAIFESQNLGAIGDAPEAAGRDGN